MRQCSPPVMTGGSRPKRALTIRATWPGGTIGIAGAALAGGADGCDGPGNAGGGTGGGGASSIGAGEGGGASTAPPPGGTKLWPPPTAPGGRGTESNPGGTVVCACACEATTSSISPAADRNRQRANGTTRRRAVMHPVYCAKSGKFKPSPALSPVW